MPSYYPPKKNAEYIFYISLASQAQANTFQSNPTLASGDFKVSIDGGALANPATLPAVTPASSKLVKVTLSASEMNGDNIIFIASDAAGAEWRDLTVNIQTAARQIDDLAFPTTSGRSLDVTATGAAGIDWSNVENQSTSVTLSGTTVGTVTALAATALAAIWDRLTSALTTSGSIGKLIVDNLNATVSSRATQTSVDTIDDFVDTEVAAIKAKTDNLPASPAAVSDIPTAAQIADAVLDEAIPEPSGVFTWSGTLRTIIGWLGALSRNKITQTDILTTLRNDADNADLATSDTDDNGTVFTRDEWV